MGGSYYTWGRPRGAGQGWQSHRHSDRGRAYLAQILRAARGAGLDPQQAEDVTQATFTTFVEVAPRFEGRSSVRTWLFGILYKKIAEARRARQRARQMDEIDEAFERRFDASGNWSTPPQPVDIGLHHKRSN